MPSEVKALGGFFLRGKVVLSEWVLGGGGMSKADAVVRRFRGLQGTSVSGFHVPCRSVCAALRSS